LGRWIYCKSRLAWIYGNSSSADLHQTAQHLGLNKSLENLNALRQKLIAES
jgi:hypothetical protein